MNKHLYFCHLLVLSSPTLMMHGHTTRKFVQVYLFPTYALHTSVLHSSDTDFNITLSFYTYDVCCARINRLCI